MNQHNTPNAMAILEFCRWANISRSKAYAEIASGQLKARKIGVKTVIARDDANTWFANLRTLKSRAV